MAWYVWLAFDLLFVAMMTVAVGTPLALTVLLVRSLALPTWAVAVLAPVWAVCFLLLFAGTLRLIRALLPRLQPGSYPFPGHKQSLAWLFHFGLQRIVNQRLWSTLILNLAFVRWLVLRAMGAEVAFDMQTSSDIMVTDPYLLTVGKGAMLAARTFVAGHLIADGRLTLAPVRVAPGVQVMGEVSLAPGVTIGENTVVGPGTKLLAHVQVGADVYLGLGCMLYEGVVIGDNTVIGHQAVLEAGVHLGEGAVVAAGARVPRGTQLADGEHYPPRNAQRMTIDA